MKINLNNIVLISEKLKNKKKVTKNFEIKEKLKLKKISILD